MKCLKIITPLKYLLLLILLFNISCSDDNDTTDDPIIIEVTTADFSVNIDENPSVGQILGTVTGSTNQGSVTFSILNQLPEGSISIDANSGELKVANAENFDFETNPIITATVKVTNGNVFGNASITISLIDVNEDIVYEGMVYLKTQEEVETFGSNGYTHINGSLTLGIFMGPDYSNITDLSALSSLTSIENHVNIMYNAELTTLDGLENLSHIGSYLMIMENTVLVDIGSLMGLTTIQGYLGIDDNEALTHLNGLNNITSIGESVRIDDNVSLSDISALSNIVTIGHSLEISANDNISGINFPSLTTIGENLYLWGNDLISNLDSLSALTTIGEDIYIQQNFSLINFCGLENVIIGGGFDGYYDVYYNAYNPTQQDIIDGNCSL